MAFFNVFLALFIGIGLVAAGFGVRGLVRDHLAASWPQAAGWITESTVITDSSGDGVTYKPGIKYRYTVNGQEFTGQRISFGAGGMSSGGNYARNYTNKYPVGKETRVAYQPDQPSVSVLETGITKRSFVGVVFGLGFALFGLWFKLIVWIMDS